MASDLADTGLPIKGKCQEESMPTTNGKKKKKTEDEPFLQDVESLLF